MKRSTILIILLTAIAGALIWMGLRGDGGEADQPLVDEVQDALDEDAAKGRFEGKLGDFRVHQAVDGQPPPDAGDAEIVLCPATNPVMDTASLRNHELWSDAFEPTGTGWACNNGEVVLVNNSDHEDPAPSPGLSRFYIDSTPLALVRDAPADRLELIEVEGQPALLERPVDVYPYATASIAVIERFPRGDVPGIAVLVERAASVDQAIDLAEQLIP